MGGLVILRKPAAEVKSEGAFDSRDRLQTSRGPSLRSSANPEATLLSVARIRWIAETS